MKPLPKWRPIPGYDGYYEVSSLGDVRGVDRTIPDKRLGSQRKKGKLMKPYIRRGYKRVALTRYGKTKHISVHTLVLLTFIGPKPPGMEARHKDGDRLKNRASNLVWGTPEDNQQDKVRHGTDTPGAKLTWEQVREIRKKYDANRFKWGIVRGLAREYGVYHATIRNIVHGKAWVE